MKKNHNKNYTLYWMAFISALLTIPISILIVNKVQAGNVEKTVMIMAVFLVFLIAVTILYKSVFKVTVQEITQDDKVTDLDRIYYALTESRKEHTNALVRRCIDAAEEQILRFKRRKDVLLQVAGTELTSDDNSAFGGLVQTVEDAIVLHMERLVNRIEIFDDQGIPDIIRQNIGFIEEQLQKNNEILLEFETLITETSRMGEIKEETDISKLRDVVNAMQSLRVDHENPMDELEKKYNKERVIDEQK